MKVEWHDKSITCSCVSNWFLFYDPEGQGGVFKVMKNDHVLVFLAV